MIGKKKHTEIYNLARKLWKKHKSEKELKERIVEIEIHKGKDYAHRINSYLHAFELREAEKRAATEWFSDIDNINIFPKGFKNFHPTKKKIYVNAQKKAKEMLKQEKNISRKEKRLIDKLSIFYLKKRKTIPWGVIPKKMKRKDISHKILSDAHKIAGRAKYLHDIWTKHPDSKPLHMTKQDETIWNELGKGEKGKYAFLGLRQKEKGKETEEKKEEKVKTKRQLMTELFKNKEYLKNSYRSIKAAEQRIRELSKNNWYRQTDLSKADIDSLLKIGYHASKKNVWDFNNSLQSIIAYKEGGFKKGTESIHHFSKKYFAKEIVPSIQVEQTIPGTKSRVDVVIPMKNKKIAVEFQESNELGPQRILSKFDIIKNNFDILVIVCDQQYKHKYEGLKSDKVHVLNNKEFIHYIKDIS